MYHLDKMKEKRMSQEIVTKNQEMDGGEKELGDQKGDRGGGSSSKC